MLEEGPKEYNKTIINIVFDIGISWGIVGRERITTYIIRRFSIVHERNIPFADYIVFAIGEKHPRFQVLLHNRESAWRVDVTLHMGNQ